MYNYMTEEEKKRHPYYQIMDFDGVDLLNELDCWSRLDILDWLQWNDPNGVYMDDDTYREAGHRIERHEALEIILRQITENRE